MALKKSELYSSLWKSCDELRGGMDASQYKDYVLVLLFVKYVSDKAAGNKEYLLNVPPGGGFKDMVAVKGDPEIGDKINKIIAKLAKANDLEEVIDRSAAVHRAAMRSAVMASAASSSVRNCTAIRTCRVRSSSADGAARGYGFERALKRGS